jgi:hypothetical protein
VSLIDREADSAMTAVLRDGTAKLVGLGELVTRNLGTSRYVFLKVADHVQRQVAGEGPAIVGPFATAIAAAIRGELVVLGKLGCLRVQTTVTFRTSRFVERALSGRSSTMLGEHAIAAWLARPIVLESTIVNPVKVASLLARECPDARPLLDEVERGYAQKTHNEICARRGLQPGTVFASITDAEVDPEAQDHWAMIFRGPDPLVVRTQGDRERELRLSHWLSAVRALTALDELAGDHLISPGELRQVIAHLESFAPGVAYAWNAFPY